MNIATINALLASAGEKGQLASLSELTSSTGTIDFQSLLIAAGKDSKLPAGNLTAELQALFAGKLPANGVDSAVAALLAGKNTFPGEIPPAGKASPVSVSEPVLPAAADSRSDATEALLAAIAQAMSGQPVAPVNNPQPAEQASTSLTAHQATTLGAASTTLPPALSSYFANPSQQASNALTEPLNREASPTNPALFQVDRSAPAPMANRVSTNAPFVETTVQSTGIPAQSLLNEPLRSPLPSTTQAAPGNLASKAAASPDTPPTAAAAAQSLTTAITSQSNPSGMPSPGDLPSAMEAVSEAANTAGTLNLPPALAPAPAQPARGADVQAPPAAISTPLHERAAWTQDFGDRIVWMAKQDQQSADIRITPANLGPVQISLNIEDGKANAIFVSPHAEVRQALEEALPRLREMLNASGISLGQANVGSQMPQQQSDSAARFAAAPRNPGENAILAGIEGNGSATSVSPIQRGRGLVDLFA